MAQLPLASGARLNQFNQLKLLENIKAEQLGRAGFGWGAAPKMWSEKRKDLMISGAVKVEDEWKTWEVMVEVGGGGGCLRQG